MNSRTGLLALIAASRTLGAQSLARLDSIVPALMKRYDVPGVALAVVRADSVLALKGFGIARVRDSAAVDPARTLFRLASVSKLFVATAVVQEIERGVIDPQADVNRYLEFRVPNTWREPVTIERLLTHTAGFDERIIGYAAPSVDSIGPLGAHLATNLPYRGWRPGEVIGYSNYGFALAAHVGERTSGLPFDQYARERVFLPLGMTRTFYLRVPDSLRRDVADGHFCDSKRCSTAPDVFSRPYPVGLAYSTAADMARFLVDELRDSMGTGRMQRQHFTADSMLPGMSYAFFNQRHRGHRVLAHGGNIPGVNNLLFLVPDARLGVYFVANGGRSAFGAALRDTLLAMLVPARTEARRPPASLDERYVRTLAGPYQIARYAHRTIEAFPSFFATSTTVQYRRGRLVLPYPNGEVEFEPIDSLHFRDVGGDRLIAFRRDERGRVTHLVAPIPFFGAEIPGVLERREWYDGAHFLNEYVSWLVLGPLLILVAAWPIVAGIQWWRRRSHGDRSIRHTGERVALGAALSFNVAWIAFAFGFIARTVRMMSAGTGIVYGVRPAFRAALVVPWILAALAMVILLDAAVAWRRQWWDWPRRGLYSFLMIGAVMTVAFLVRWNYLPMRF
jgi:CubicO group peptidase (beta-lactamase class C family)